MIKGLYIHIPFCDYICPYCDFKKRLKDDYIEERYRDSLIKEIMHKKEYYKNINTIYIGGGTPTCFKYLEDILLTLSKVINLTKIKEFTIESTINRCLDYIDIYTKYNVNRLSIGVESYNSNIRKYLKRDNNNAQDLINKIKAIREKGINNINLDFIYSLPYSTIESTKEDLDLIKEVDPEHISFYDLIVEENTILSYDLKRGKVTLPDELTQVKMRSLINRTLKSYGYHQYEISNWAKPRKESIHNKYYWNLTEYISVGVSSHSLINSKREYNTLNISEYIRCIENDDFNTIRKDEDTNLKSEYFLMGLRLNKGVSIEKYKMLFNSNPFNDFDLDRLIKRKLLIRNKDNIRLSKRGRDIGNYVFIDFI